MTDRKDPPQRRALHFDIDTYQHYLDREDIPEEAKKQLLQAVWNMVTAFVDLGFELHPLQSTASKTCGQDADGLALSARSEVESKISNKSTGGARDQ